MIRAVVGTLLLLSSIQIEAIAQSSRAAQTCIPKGELVAYSGQRVTSQPVCQAEQPTLAPGAPYKFVCYSATKIFSVIGANGVALPGCDPPVDRPTPCISNAQANCQRKGPGENLNGPTITLPYGTSLIDPRPTFTWQSVPSSATYIVKVKGSGVDWARPTSSIKFAYPEEEKALQPGNVYTVAVIAKGGPPSSDTKTFSMLSDADIQKVKAAEEQIKGWNLEPDKTATVLDGLYIGKGLLDQSIQVLQQRIQSGTQSAQLYQRLGDRYLEAGLLDQAGPLYSQARVLAQQHGDTNVVAQAQAGLEKINELRASRQPR